MIIHRKREKQTDKNLRKCDKSYVNIHRKREE